MELHDEQGGRCIYCNKPLEYTRLINEDHYAEIDHALPLSRTCDDSQSNKVLVCKQCNQEKRNRTPFEWANDGGVDWDSFSLRITRNKKLGQRKRQKLLCRDLSAEASNGFINRNLNDTRYASRAAKLFIEDHLAFPEDGHKQHVFAVAGSCTAILRHAWGIRKSREENSVHHAVDAAVIAACTQQNVIAIANASEKKAYTPKDRRKELFRATEPWSGFSDEIAAWEARIVPTHMIDHKVGGRVFEDTVYAYQGIREDGQVGLLKGGTGGKEHLKAHSNFVIRDDGSALIVDELAFINLWLDPDGNKGKGQIYLEPVYRADIPFMDRTDYVRRYVPPQSDKKPRAFWQPIPKCAKKNKPITLFPHDAILVKGKVRRLRGIDISSCKWKLYDPRGELNDAEAVRGLALMSLDSSNLPTPIHEDVLGLSLLDMDTGAVVRSEK